MCQALIAGPRGPPPETHAIYGGNSELRIMHRRLELIKTTLCNISVPVWKKQERGRELSRIFY